MGTDEEREAGSFDQISQQQLQIYAAELHQHFQAEQRLRQELQELNRLLEQRVRELNALNRLFQQHLAERIETVQTYQEFLRQLQELARETTSLAERAQAQPSLDIQDLPSQRPSNGEQEVP